MIEKVAKYIKSRPRTIQVAKDGKWEQSWIIELSQGSPSRMDIQDYMNRGAYKDVAVEVVFDEPQGQHFILGLTYNDYLHVKTAEEFLGVFIDASIHYDTFQSFIVKLNHQIIGQNVLFAGSPDLIRIGIVNHWFTVGPCLVWQKGWPKEMSKMQLDQRLATKPEVIETKLNYQGMSFIFNIKGDAPGLCHWMKSPCSMKEGDLWRLDRAMILRYLHDWQDFTIS